MFQIVTKLKSLKKPIKQLMWQKGNVHERVIKIRVELEEVQRNLDRDPHNVIFREEESIYLQSFNEAKLDEERFLKQLSKVQ